jgi:MFS family permease
MKSLIADSGSKHALYTISILGFIFTLHLTLPVYVNSIFLSQFVSEDAVGYLYTAGSILSVLALVKVTPLLRRFGNYRLSMGLLAVEGIALVAFALSSDIRILAPLFVLMVAVGNVIAFNIDVFLEASTGTGNTGSIRGFYLTVVNMAWLVSPLIAGMLGDGNDDFSAIYLAAAALLIPVLMLLRKNFRSFEDKHYPDADLGKTFWSVCCDNNLSKIFGLNIFLNFFFAWMVIYMPLYLHDQMGFNLGETGIIFTVMLLPFIIFEIPLGRFEDKRWAEREVLVAGFLIMTLSTAVLAYITVPNVWLWALMLFTTRIGAAVSEITMETYFFKQVDAADSSVLGLFRTTRHVAYIVAPILASVLLSFISLRLSFLFVAGVCLIGMFYALTIKDKEPEKC